MKIRSIFLVLSSFILLWVLYSIAFWGRPVPFQFLITQRMDGNGDGLADVWQVSRSSDGKVTVVEQDTNFDGRIDRLQFSNPGVRILDLSREANPRRKLAVCLDGVPFDDIAALWDEGYFREFSRPGKLISVFPSLSDIALTDAFHTERVPGYENLYFDVERNQISGGATSTVSKVRMPYLDALDYDEPGIFKGIAYLVPVRTFHADLGRFLKRYAASSLGTYKSHICSTDSVCHIMSRQEFRRYLLEVDKLLRQIFIQEKGQLDFTVFSDHGNSHVVTNRRVALDSFLAQHGFRLESSLKDERSVVVPGFGLVGAMAMYFQPQNTKRLAELLPQLEGVDLAVYLEGKTVQVVSANGTASIDANEDGRRLKYQALRGDPLGLTPVIERMRQQGVLDEGRYATSEAWFDASAEHEYADAVNALYSGITNHVSNRANLLVSFKDGYHFGSTFFEKLVTMQSTHGNLRRTSMTGFFMRNGSMTRQIMPSRELLKNF